MNYKETLDLINVLSFVIGVENLSLNDIQINKLEEHLNKQDKQYERIIELLERGVQDGNSGQIK